MIPIKMGHKGRSMLPVYSPGGTRVCEIPSEPRSRVRARPHGSGPAAWRSGPRQSCGLGGDLLVEAQVLLDRGDSDFELEAFVEIVRHVVFDDGEIARVVIQNLRVLVERLGVVGKRGLHVGDVRGDGGEAAFDHFAEVFESRFLRGHTRGV
jgi:hypothetical protein